MPDTHVNQDQSSDHSTGAQLDMACDQFEAACQTGNAPSIQNYLAGWKEPLRSQLERELRILIEEYFGDSGNVPRRPSTGRQRDRANKVQPELELPERVGRYRIDGVLGHGGFGYVLRGFDESLKRSVAIKVPHPHMVRNKADGELYFSEAQAVAQLDHANIVPVFDVGRTEKFPCYIVSKLIDGQTLRNYVDQNSKGFLAIAGMIAKISEALHFAHLRGFTHRDIKPGNILTDQKGEPYIVDFGVALKDGNANQGPRFVGTPAYMSPEQARGEGHRVDGRSDIFSLGAVLYELLVKRRPFQSQLQSELFEQIVSQEPRPPRQINDRVPRALEHICLKALSKRVSDRYTTAQDMAEDLHDFMRSVDPRHHHPDPSTEDDPSFAKPSNTSSSTVYSRIVPKGLRSFDLQDADFFLELLPGPRGHDKLPESIRFWKQRIESGSDESFNVGMIYGPSGCGKSSLMKAGLLPRLDSTIRCVYVEATYDETESRLLQELRRQAPEVSGSRGLTSAIATLRQSNQSHKVLIVIDQFEQWLHVNRNPDAELIAALRQCDGRNVQCIVMVRDDFWMASTRFMKAIEVPLVDGENSAAVDLFSIQHAERVLRAFGRALGTLPESPTPIPDAQNQFVSQAVQSLASDGHVVSVHVALFAEMMKNRPWKPGTLESVGGAEGVGAAFLESTFGASNAPPENRYHQKAARAVLSCLLPPPGTEIKGHMQSRQTLLRASGYSDVNEFDELITILDSKLRLITPTDTPLESLNPTDSLNASETNFYQLTHDYLVPSLRQWLSRKQKETRKGRAELLLGERTSIWHAKPSWRNLPSLWEYGRIALLTDGRDWSEDQKVMMHASRRRHFWRCLFLVFLIIGLGLIGYEIQSRFQANSIVERLKSAQPDAIPAILDQLKPYQQEAEFKLRSIIESPPVTPDEHRQQINARLALISDTTNRNVLCNEFLNEQTGLNYLRVIRNELLHYADEIGDRFWSVLSDPSENPGRRFRSALLLADTHSNSDSWNETNLRFIAQELVSSNPEHQIVFRRLLRPIGDRLVGELKKIYLNKDNDTQMQVSSANALFHFCSSDTGRLTKLIVEASPRQHEILFPQLKSVNDPAIQRQLQRIVDDEQVWVEFTRSEVEQCAESARRRAVAAITLLRLGAGSGFTNAFRAERDTGALASFYVLCREFDVTATDLLDHFDFVKNELERSVGTDRSTAIRVVYGMLMSLGKYSIDEIPIEQRAPMIKQLADWFENDPSATIHSVSGWLLRRWGQEELARSIEQRVVPYDENREWFTVVIDLPQHSFYYTFIVLPPGEYIFRKVASDKEFPSRKDLVPTPRGELVSIDNDVIYRDSMPYRFAVLDREISFRELEASIGVTGWRNTAWSGKGPIDDLAAVGPTWYESVLFCRWITEQSGMSEHEQVYEDLATLDESQHPRNPLASNFPLDWPSELNRPGFRLPTTWEAHCATMCRYLFRGPQDDFAMTMQDRRGSPPDRPRTFPPNPFGFFDIAAYNVCEWNHNGVPLEISKSLSGDDTQRNYAKSYDSYHGWIDPSEQRNFLGFRLACTLPPSKSSSGDSSD